MIVNINKEFAIRCQRKRISYNGFPEYPERFLRQKIRDSRQQIMSKICNIFIINTIILLKIE